MVVFLSNLVLLGVVRMFNDHRGSWLKFCLGQLVLV